MLNFFFILGRLRFHYDNDNEYEKDNEISLAFSSGFCTKEMNNSSLPFRCLLQR